MKRLVRLIAVGVVIVGLVVALIVVQNSEGDQEPEERAFTIPEGDDPDRVRLLESSQDEIESVLIEIAGEEPLEIARTAEDTFLPVYEYEAEFLGSSVSRIVNQATSLSSRRVIGEVESQADFGLDEPQAVITVTRTDGSSQVIRVGSLTPAQDAYYVSRPDDPIVYSVFNSWIRAFLTDLDSLRVREIPIVAVEAVERVELTNFDGRRVVVQTIPEWDTDPEMGFAAYATTEPYDRRFQTNTFWFETVAPLLPELSIVRFVDDAPTSLAAYGLAPPAASLLMRDAEGELAFEVGSETEGGRFARFAGSDSVVVLSGTEEILSVRPYEMISAFALILNIELVDRFTVRTPSESFVGSIEREGEGDDLVERYFLNDTRIDEELFKDLYQWAIGLQFDTEIDGVENGPVRITSAPLATITYELNNGQGERSVSFASFNNNFVAVVRDGEAEFLMSRAKLNRMLDAFRDEVD